MKKFDKLRNIKKANILAEQRYRMKLNESTEGDLISIISQKINNFSTEEQNFNDGKFFISLFNDRIEGFAMNGVNIDTIAIDVNGTYKMISAGYYKPGRYYGPPEDTYPDEGENPEFDINITDIKIGNLDEGGNLVPIIEVVGPDVKKMPKQILDVIEDRVIDMLLESGEFDSDDDGPDYDGPDDYDPRGEDREWGGIDW